jgi:hypothetical protein
LKPGTTIGRALYLSGEATRTGLGTKKISEIFGAAADEGMSVTL